MTARWVPAIIWLTSFSSSWIVVSVFMYHSPFGRCTLCTNFLWTCKHRECAVLELSRHHRDTRAMTSVSSSSNIPDMSRISMNIDSRLVWNVQPSELMPAQLFSIIFPALNLYTIFRVNSYSSIRWTNTSSQKKKIILYAAIRLIWFLNPIFLVSNQHVCRVSYANHIFKLFTYRLNPGR